MQISFRKASEDSQIELEFIIDPFHSMTIWNCALKQYTFLSRIPTAALRKI